MQALQCKSGVFGKAAVARPVRVAAPSRARLAVCASYKNQENINLEKVAIYKRHDADVGSSEVQVARLSARIAQISAHLAQNRKDFAARRGLEAILSQRKTLLQYLFRTDRATYDKLISEYKIRSVIVGDTRGAARKSEELAA
ncbi:hypothetical protein HYH02_011812 [Chlamydomonas schloesseri]|uniref:30S ribosomal protein S15 n=1 Tax=Chlamydomonas schloesseri TaxID=2026947 RepID=A0A835SYJ4_9CHLO|nr:hypothetical protein HYH02_011812 [Chlamydomonas schloesseri]|eukprot:KAG2435518.1 hypothetical protein HYH02_011812 [Chlamydomonas schloesseri]